MLMARAAEGKKMIGGFLNAELKTLKFDVTCNERDWNERTMQNTPHLIWMINSLGLSTH